MGELRIERTSIPGLLVVRLELHPDARGWFKENWQREKMVAAGLPDFGPVQNNMSFNTSAGTTRGIHAEPWDKLVSAAKGRFFGAWVDLRPGKSFGKVFTIEFDESTAIFVPRGVGNAYQTLTADGVYSYLVNDHWSPSKISQYAYVNLTDPTLDITWPFPLDQVEISAKDRAHPLLADARPVPAPKTVILGAKGQLGRALSVVFPQADRVDMDELDLGDATALAAWPWADYELVLNAAAWTDVDSAETTEGRRGAWLTNATVPAKLAQLAIRHRFTLVHVSSDYVFDGTQPAWTEDDDVAPLSVYGQSKAAGDLAVSTVPHHYVLRTSWVVGDGANFIKTMASLADQGISPKVVNDQVGRLTHTSNLAAAIKHLLDVGAPFGTYNCTDGGEPVSWADIAKAVFVRQGRDPSDVMPVSTAEYYKDKTGIAPRPGCSVLDLSKLEATGYRVPIIPVG